MSDASPRLPIQGCHLAITASCSARAVDSFAVQNFLMHDFFDDLRQGHYAIRDATIPR
jgi:hypothetical protein